MRELILASGSPRRKSLLENYGFCIKTVLPDLDESTIRAESPQSLVTALAQAKNRSVAPSFPNNTVLAADTVVCIDGSILGKPHGEDEACGMLRMLSGKTHTVFTGVCISADGSETAFYARTDVTFYTLSDSQIKRYVSTGSPFDKAGGYGIQDDMGIAFVSSVKGELSNVIGLPMGRVITELIKTGDIK